MLRLHDRRVNTGEINVFFALIVLAHDVVALDDELHLEPMAKPLAELAQHVTPYLLLWLLPKGWYTFMDELLALQAFSQGGHQWHWPR